MKWILTTHPNDDWIAIQRRQLRNHGWLFDSTTVASVGVSRQLFDHELIACGGPNSSSRHRRNLVQLCSFMLKRAADDDLMIVFDGDAFPIASADEVLVQLEVFPVLTVESCGRKLRERVDCSFLAMRVGLWRELGCNWDAVRGGKRTGCVDTGGALTVELRRRDIAWKTLRRSNRVEPCYPLFAVYENAIYHHRNGFQPHGPLTLPSFDVAIARSFWGNETVGRSELATWKNRLSSLMHARLAESEKPIATLIGGNLITDDMRRRWT